MAGTLGYLLSVCAVMFLGAYGAGSLPLVVDIGEARLRQVAAFGAGLLIGTALAVIIPEGFAALDEVQEADRIHAAPGAALIFGFVAMLLLDNLQHSSHVKQRTSPLSSPRGTSIDGFPAETSAGHDPAQRALIGLVIHSAADGFAVGTATTSDNAMLSAMVGLAMVLHKAPVAFGLATYLMNAKWSWSRAQRGILLFSAASPIVALLTYAVLRHIPMLSTPFAIALCVIFSGGTFLYAACIHILPEVKGTNHSFTTVQLVGLVVGSFLPLALSSFHSHGGSHSTGAHDMTAHHHHP